MNTPPSDAVGGLSPDWYCSGGSKEDELEIQLRNLRSKVAHLEHIVSEKDREIEELSTNLREERKLEAESLSNMKTGSEKLLEQKKLQVQQLNSAIKKLNESLRKKDQQLSTIVAHNLRADGAYTETAAELSEAKLNLRHSEADRSKERVAIQRLEGQMTTLTAQNHRLDELVQQYRLELTRKENALNTQQRNNENQSRLRHLQSMEVVEALGEATAHLTRLENDLNEQESILLSGTGLLASCTPPVARPGQRVRVNITTTSTAAPRMSSSSNALDFSPVTLVSADAQATTYTMLFTTGSREGTAQVIFTTDMGSAQTTVVVEGSQTLFDISGSEVTMGSICYENEPMEVLITTRDTVANLVVASLRDEEIQVPESPLRRSSLASAGSALEPSAFSSGVKSARSPTVVVNGASIVQHVKRVAKHTHKLVVCPKQGKCVTVQLVDDTGPVAAACCEVKTAMPDLSRTVVEAAGVMTVGDRGTVKVKLYDAGGRPCPPPAGVPPSDLIKPSCGENGAEDATDLEGEILTFGFGEYGFHFVPLAIGKTTLNVSVGNAYKETVAVRVVEAGGAAVFDNFEVNAAPPSMCVPLESDVSLSVLFYDEDGRPAASAPEPAVLDISIEGDAFTLTGVAPDPNVPSSLVVTLLPEQGGTSNVTISCKGGSKKATFPIFCADKEHVGQYHKVGLSVCGSSVVPGGSFDVFASPVDCLGNVLPCFPDYVKDEGLTAMLEGTDVDVPLVACSGGKLKANLTAPLNEGFYIVAVGRTQVAVEVSTSTIMSSKSVAETSKVLINRLPGILYSLRAREQAFKNARAEATDAVQEWERAKALNDELERHTTEEVTKALAAANRERDTMQIKIDDLKSSLASERREEEEFQKRWDEREESLEKERAQRAEDRRLWIEERNRLTDLDEENAKVIAALRKQITDLQAKGKQQQVVMQRKITEQVEEAQKVIAAEEAKWEIDRSTYEVRCNKVAERVEELKEELEVERRRSEQGNATISQLEQRMTSLKVEAQELRHTNEKSLSEAEQVKEELVESGVQSTKKIDELERHHAQLIATSNKTHLETVTSLQNEIAVLKEQHKQALESTALEGEARKAAALAQLETEKMRIVQEKEEQALANEDLLTQIRTAHREILAAQDAKENDNRLWETEKRSLERMLEERNQTVRDAEQRCADEIGTNKALVEHNKSLWLNEKQLLTERVSSLEEEARSASEHWESKFSTEKQILSNEKASWAHERQELVISISKLKERLDDTVKHGNKVLENEKLQIDDERRQWMNERADFRARLNDLQQTQDDAVRKYTRTIEEIKSHAEEEREEWCIAKAELESELQDTKAHQTNTAADTRREMSTLKGQLEALRHEAAQQQAQHEQELKQRDEQADVEKRKAVKQLQVTREDFEVEKEKYKRETISLRQQAENLQATLEDAHSRHVMKMEETELERQKWVAEKAQLRDRLAVIEASAAELAEDHKQQLGEHDRQLAAVKKESEAVLQAKISQIEAHMATRMQQEAADMEAKHALAAEEWEAALVRAAESHKAEIARIQAAAEERENMADSYLDTAKENYKIEIDKLEAELAKAKTEKVAARQRAETERSEERQRSRQEMQQVVDEHERERKQWETSRDELLKASDEMKMAHQREVNELNRQLQRAGLDEAEAQQEESRKEMASLRVAWQKQLAAAHDAHERDRAAFAKEREEWRSERSKLWNERNSNKQLLEASLAEAMQARDDAELLATQRVEEITKLLDRNTEMEDLLQSARRKLEERASVEQQLLDSGKDEWEQEKGDLHAQMEHLRDNMEHQQNERLKLQQEIEELQRQADEAMTDSTSKHHKKVDVLRKELDLQNAAVAKLQREISKQVASNEQLQKKMAEESKQATTEAHNLQHASETGLQSAKHRIDELEQEVSTQQQKLQDANTIHVRQVNEFEEEKEQLMQEYEDLRNRHSEIQANYNTQIQKSAEEAQKLRVVSSMSDTEWAAKEQRWTESMEEANKQLQQERELSNERLVKAQAAIEEQLENSENEKTDLRAQLQSTEAALALEKQTRSETDTWHKDKLESEKQAWARDRDHTAQQLESYKKLLQETQQKQQESLEAMSSERKQWLAERVKLREEATALRTQLSVCPNHTTHHATGSRAIVH